MGIQERRARERQARRTTVLDATRVLVRQRGLNGTTTKQIAEQCELSEATVFRYFQSKDEIFVSLLLEGIEFMASGIEQAFAGNRPAEEKLAALWRFYTELRTAHPEYYHVFAYLTHPDSTAAVTEEVKAELARRSGDDFRRIAALLHETLGTADARVAADVLWSTFMGLMVLRDSRVNLGANPHPTDPELAAAFKLVLHGLLPAPPPQQEK